MQCNSCVQTGVCAHVMWYGRSTSLSSSRYLATSAGLLAWGRSILLAKNRIGTWFFWMSARRSKTDEGGQTQRAHTESAHTERVQTHTDTNRHTQNSTPNQMNGTSTLTHSTASTRHQTTQRESECWSHKSVCTCLSAGELAELAALPSA